VDKEIARLKELQAMGIPTLILSLQEQNQDTSNSWTAGTVYRLNFLQGHGIPCPLIVFVIRDVAIQRLYQYQNSKSQKIDHIDWIWYHEFPRLFGDCTVEVF